MPSESARGTGGEYIVGPSSGVLYCRPLSGLSIGVDNTAVTISELAWHLGPNGRFAGCYEGLSLPDYRALQSVVRENSCCRACGMQRLVDILGFTKGGVTRIVSRLEKQGLVVRDRISGDGRVCCVHPTEVGAAMAERISRCLSEQLEAVLESLPGSVSGTSSEDAQELLCALAEQLSGADGRG